MKIWHVKSSVKIHSLSQSQIWNLSSFFLPWKAVFTQSSIEELDHKAKEKLPAVLMRLSCQLFFEWLRNCVQETIELWPKYRETKLKSTKKRNFLYQLFFEWLGNCVQETYWTLTKIPRNEAKIDKETEFLSSEGHLFNFSWLLPDFSFFTGCRTG